MPTIKSYSDLQQSKKLAEILPIESADMQWIIDDLGESFPFPINDRVNENEEPCWSLAALISALPNDTSLLYFDDAYQMVYDKKPYVISNKFDNPVDACVDMIEKLHELNLL